MAQPTRLQKIIVSIVLVAVGIFFIWADTSKFRVANIENKAKSVADDYITTQKKLEDNGYSFTFNFDKAESNIKKSGVLNKEETNKDFKIDGKSFADGMGMRITKAHNLAYGIKNTIADSNMNGEYKSTKETAYGIKQDCKALKKLYSEGILGEDFPEDYAPIKDKFKAKENILENELDLIIDKADKMDSDEMMSAIRVLGNFVKTCEVTT